MEYSYIPTPDPVFSLLQYIVLIEVSGKKMTLHKYAVGEGNISVASSDNCGYVSFDITPKLDKC